MLSLNKIYKQLKGLNKSPQDYFCLRQKCAPFDLLPWLSVQAESVKMFWRDKQAVEGVALLGVCHSVNNIADPTRIMTQRYYGGVGFQPESSSWQSFRHSQFVLPRLEIRQTSKGGELYCHLDCRTNSLEDEVQACLSLLDGLQNTLLDIKNYNDNALKSRTDAPTKAQWHDLVNQALNAEQQSKFSKVVLSRVTTLKFQHALDPWQLLARLGEVNGNCYQFAVQFSAGEVFIGSSPERLYLRRDRQLTTESLAGTIRRGTTPEQDQQRATTLQNDSKLTRENSLVRDDILSRLQSLSCSLGVEEVGVVKLNQVQHLQQGIHAVLHDDIKDQQLLQVLHPTPAVGGAPRQAALGFILANEPYHRGWYAGVVGYLSAQQSELSVAIRSALIVQDEIKIYAGAGILKGSDAVTEWQELDDKIITLLELLR